jgi:hypothetical protein
MPLPEGVRLAVLLLAARLGRRKRLQQQRTAFYRLLVL